jgi:hypothetical protein
VPLDGPAAFVCLVSFCDWDEAVRPGPGLEYTRWLGQVLAEAVFLYADGGEARQPLRRRFETFVPSYGWGNLAFAAVSHRPNTPRQLSDALSNGKDWGNLQTVVNAGAYVRDGDATLWMSALENPEPERPLRALRVEARSEAALVLCGATVFSGRENPLRYDRLTLYRVTVPEGAAEEGRWTLEVDLGVVARTFVANAFDPEAWLRAPDAGLGERARPDEGTRHLYAEITASPEATLVLTDTTTGAEYAFDLGRVEPRRELEARSGGARLEVLETRKVWLHGRVLDGAMGKPTPARLAFRSEEGRYIPPYGHATEINDGWFQDYGADVKMMDATYAYVDGSFQVELPVGDVYVEISKGFEYTPLRRKLRIEAGQRDLDLSLSRLVDLRTEGWVTADTHVHFLSPSTAVLEGQAEGLNLVSLLAAQWGDLFTNVGDLPHGPLVSADGETQVQVSTENRQHLLGHLGLVGGKGAPAFPMSASGPGESYLGDPLWNSMSEWADAQRRRDGLVVAVHFPYPTAEIAAEIALGKVDALEMLFPFASDFVTRQFVEWYGYLNCGYRLPAVGGTDKMGAYMPVGANRTYAQIGSGELTFDNWATAVRRGRTFTTTGPLLQLEVDGHGPGDEIEIGAGGATLEARAQARSFVPFQSLELVWNGEIVASSEDRAGRREMTLVEKVPVSGPGWLAARCGSPFSPTATWWMGVRAHTSPIYVKRSGEELFSSPVAEYMLTLIDGAETWTNTLATPSDAERMEKVRTLLRSAREAVHRRMHAHGIAH